MINFQRVSYRSGWFHMLFYGNLIHIVGYMIIAAWVAALLDKAGVRKF